MSVLSTVRKEQENKVYAAMHHNKSLYTQKQPEVTAFRAETVVLSFIMVCHSKQGAQWVAKFGTDVVQSVL